MKYSRSSVMKPIAGSITMYDILLHDIFLQYLFYDIYFTVFCDQI